MDFSIDNSIFPILEEIRRNDRRFSIFCLVSFSRFRQFFKIGSPNNPRKFCRKIKKAASASIYIWHLEVFAETGGELTVVYS